MFHVSEQEKLIEVQQTRIKLLTDARQTKCFFFFPLIPPCRAIKTFILYRIILVLSRNTSDTVRTTCINTSKHTRITTLTTFAIVTELTCCTFTTSIESVSWCDPISGTCCARRSQLERLHVSTWYAIRASIRTGYFK